MRDSDDDEDDDVIVVVVVAVVEEGACAYREDDIDVEGRGDEDAGVEGEEELC